MYIGRVIIAFGIGIFIGVALLIKAFISGKVRLPSTEKDFIKNYKDLLGRLLLTERKIEIIENQFSKYFLTIHSATDYSRAIEIYTIVQDVVSNVEKMVSDNRHSDAEDIILVLLGTQKKASPALCEEVKVPINDLRHWDKTIDLCLENVCSALEKTAISFENIRKVDTEINQEKRRKTFTEIAELKSLLDITR